MTEETMLERCAKAISDSLPVYIGDPEALMEVAKAALEAIRSPSDKALDAMCENRPDVNDCPFSYAAAQEIWEAGIRAILQDRA